MDLLGFQVATDAAGLDVDDRTGSDVERITGHLDGENRLIKTDRRANVLRQLCVCRHLFFRQGLLDEQEIERVEFRKMIGILEPVGGVRVDLQQETIAECAAHCTNGLDVEAGLDLQLDAQIAIVEILLYHPQQVVDRRLNANRDSRSNTGLRRTHETGKASAFAAKLVVEQRRFEDGFSHEVSADTTHRFVERLGSRPSRDFRQEELAQDVLATIDVLARVHRLAHRGALSPTDDSVTDHLEIQQFSGGLHAEAGAKRRHQLDVRAAEANLCDHARTTA